VGEFVSTSATSEIPSRIFPKPFKFKGGGRGVTVLKVIAGDWAILRQRAIEGDKLRTVVSIDPLVTTTAPATPPATMTRRIATAMSAFSDGNNPVPERNARTQRHCRHGLSETLTLEVVAVGWLQAHTKLASTKTS
jgi:hypothetical protein